MATPSPAIRPARPDEADALSDLARRSKAHWGYPADFLARVETDLAISVADIVDHRVAVLESPDGRPLGFYHLILGEPAILEDLWLEPRSIGMGLGRILWRHALAAASAGGASAVELDADPHALGFYERMGALRVGGTASRHGPGRILPRMRIALDGASTSQRVPAETGRARAGR